MSEANPPPDDSGCPHDEQTRADARRSQILAAASECFRSRGFHGASISQISRACGMSAGHIYHYFDSKEAIIAAIVARDVDRIFKLTEDLRAAPDMLDALVAGVEQALVDNSDPSVTGIKLEILAEAARNPQIAATVQAADRLCLANLSDLLRPLRAAAGHGDSDDELDAISETMAALFDGLLVRAARNPDADVHRLAHVYREAVRFLIVDVPGRARSD